MSPWVALLLTVIGTGLLGSSMMMFMKGTYPPPFHHKKASPAVATLQIILGLTMVMHFGTPDLLAQVIETLFK